MNGPINDKEYFRALNEVRAKLRRMYMRDEFHPFALDIRSMLLPKGWQTVFEWGAVRTEGVRIQKVRTEQL